VNIEFWGLGLPEGKYSFLLDNGKIVGFGVNNTYKVLHIINPVYSHNLYYLVWCANKHEFYNLTFDPGQLYNLYPYSHPHPHPSSEPEIEIEHDHHRHHLKCLIHCLNALLLMTKSGVGITYCAPWSVLHPKGNVHSFADALDVRYDAFYTEIAETASLRFDRCLLGYIRGAEGLQNVGFDFDQWSAGGEL
jgi:N-acetylglucosamine-6-sulfatase